MKKSIVSPHTEERDRTCISIITPMYNESSNLEILQNRLSASLSQIPNLDWEWIIVDDNSEDNTFELCKQLEKLHSNIRCIKFAKNHGSHRAIFYGLSKAKHSCAVVLAADLQDPPELIPKLIQQWKLGGKIIWAVRKSSPSSKLFDKIASKFYYLLVCKVLGLKNSFPNGADFFLLDKSAIQALLKYSESNVSILALIAQLGFRQNSVFYEKDRRIYGQSGWSFEKKVKLVFDTVFSLSYKPIRFMSYTGFFIALSGFVFSAHIIMNSINGAPVEGWSSIMIAILILGGTQMIMLGVLGEYLWRTLIESKRRPLYIVEEDTSENIV